MRAGLATTCFLCSSIIIISLLTVQELCMQAGVGFALLTFILGNLFKVGWNGTQTSNGTGTKYGSVVNGNRHSLQEIRNYIISSPTQRHLEVSMVYTIGLLASDVKKCVRQNKFRGIYHTCTSGNIQITKKKNIGKFNCGSSARDHHKCTYYINSVVMITDSQNKFPAVN